VKLPHALRLSSLGNATLAPSPKMHARRLLALVSASCRPLDRGGGACASQLRQVLGFRKHASNGLVDVLRSSSHKLTPASLTHKHMPCMTVVSVGVSERAIRFESAACCMKRTLMHVLCPWMTDHRTTPPKNPPRSFPIQRATAADVGSACPLMRNSPHGRNRSHW
jgi:hypothetical protein